MFLPFWDKTMVMLIPAFILALYAQFKVKSTYNKYSKEMSESGITGKDVAKNIINSNDVYNVDIELVAGHLTDHYDPSSKKLRLSEPVYNGNSIASLGIAAHEAGHVLQHSQGYFPVYLRTVIYPVANFGSTLAFPLFFIGLFFFKSSMIMDIAIFLYIGAVVFTLVTLPVEFDASRRALFQLEKGGYLSFNELKGAKKVLSAAALTYIASAAMAVLQLIRLLSLRSED